MPLIALTGATGFIGRHLLQQLPKRGFQVQVLLRRPSRCPPGVERRDRRHRLAAQHGCGFARRGHGDPLGRPRARHVGPEDDYRSINTGDDQARAGGRAGRREALRVPVLDPRAERPGRRGHSDRPGRLADRPGRSKLEAEQGLAALGLDWAALRPVLVYGPGVKGNMAALLAQSRRRSAA